MYSAAPLNSFIREKGSELCDRGSQFGLSCLVLGVSWLLDIETRKRDMFQWSFFFNIIPLSAGLSVGCRVSDMVSYLVVR